MTTSPPNPPSLADLRQEIDRLDEAMHRLLMERGEVIETLIAVKGTQESGSAFRPGREADVMRRLAERHRGILPLDTVESIWRVIISTFTYVQAPHKVHADVSGGDAAMRDSARFHFGFTVPYVPHFGVGAVIEAVAHSAGDMGMFNAQPGSTGEAWWRALEGEESPKIIARLPFIERQDHPAGTPVFVVAKPLAEAAVREVIVFSVALERWRPEVAAAIQTLGGSIDGTAGSESGLSLVISIPGADARERLVGALSQIGIRHPTVREIGSHAARYVVDAVAKNP